MRIKNIRIEGLFDMFEHTIPLNVEERLSIVYGINGIGKTMLFKILDSLFNLNISKIFALIKSPFNILEISYVDGSLLTVVNHKNELKISFGQKNNQKLISKISSQELFKNIENSNWVNNLRREVRMSSISPDKFLLIENNEELDLEQMIERYSDYLPSNTFKEISSELKGILDKTKLHFIQTQRLIIFQPKRRRIREEIGLEKEDSVNQYSTEIANIIQSKRKERDKLSNDLQQSLHKRILNNSVDTDYSLEKLNESSSKIEKRIEELKGIGLLEDIQMDNLKVKDDIDDVKKAILSVNIQDIEKTLNIFDDLYPKFQKFIEILNERRLSFKKISLTEKGFVFTNTKGKVINASDLSSGEQHELVLLYLLLFKIPENSLILIDEPEISLHITWQKAFLDDMKEIIKLRNFDILVATHSPSIINGNWDLTIQLKDNGETE